MSKEKRGLQSEIIIDFHGILVICWSALCQDSSIIHRFYDCRLISIYGISDIWLGSISLRSALMSLSLFQIQNKLPHYNIISAWKQKLNLWKMLIYVYIILLFVWLIFYINYCSIQITPQGSSKPDNLSYQVSSMISQCSSDIRNVWLPRSSCAPINVQRDWGQMTKEKSLTVSTLLCLLWALSSS